ncbi:MAG: phosphopantetheine-binding protein [Treponema sp.]|jgi:acyl carrier protein|nr:phosphopantetheine-binding protein [Treponema sp.]
MESSLDKEIIFTKVKELLCNEFKLDSLQIEPDKRLDEDLKLDSLDMVDFIINLKDYIGEKVNPSLFKNARTVQDVVNLLAPLWKSE